MEEEQVIIIFLSLLLVIGLCLIPKLEKEQIRSEVQAKVDKMFYEAAFPLHKYYMEVENNEPNSNNNFGTSYYHNSIMAQEERLN